MTILIIGAGMAGLCAAVSAAERRMRVVVLEALEKPGGLTLESEGFLSAVDPRRLRPTGLVDTHERFLEQTFAGGGRRGRRELVESMAFESTSMLYWLETHGVEFDEELFMTGRSFFPRLHLPKNRSPKGYVEPLMREARRLGVEFHFQTPVVRVLREGRGLRVEARHAGRPVTWTSEHVIFATGTFAGDRKKLLLEDPRLAKTFVRPRETRYPTGLRLLEDLGAQSVHLAHTQRRMKPTAGTEIPTFWRNLANLIAVDEKGKRFLQEDLREANFVEELLNRTSGKFFFIGSPNWMSTPEDAAGAVPVEALARRLGLPPEALRRTVERFNADFTEGRPDALGRRRETILGPFDAERMTGIPLVVETITTLGGILTTRHAEALDREGNVMPGLYVAGDAAGGIHGRNAIAGNMLLSAAFFGRLAALTASSELLG